MKSNMKNSIRLVMCAMILFVNVDANAQFWKKKGKKSKKNVFECGYVHKKSLKERLNISNLVGKAIGGLFVKGGANFDLNESAITLIKSDHIFPSSFVNWATKTPGWETCGSYVTVMSVSKIGLPMVSATHFKIDGKELKGAGFGTYFQGYPHDDASTKKATVVDKNGNSIDVDLEPASPIKIITVNGKERGDPSLSIDGSQDIIIEIENEVKQGYTIAVQMIQKFMGTKIPIDVFYTKDKTKIIVPKEVFQSSTGFKFIKNNVLIVYKYKETLRDDLQAGAVRVISNYYDFTPLTITGELTKSAIFNYKSRITNTSTDLSKQTKYDFKFKKESPVFYHPSTAIKKIGITSFVVRANLAHKKTETTSTTSTNVTYTSTHKITRTTVSTSIKKMEKVFPGLTKDTWKSLANRLYNDFKEVVQEEYNAEIVPVQEIVNSKLYQKAIPILDTVTRNFVEVGAYSTKRIIPSIRTKRADIKVHNGKKSKTRGSTEKMINFNTFPSDFVTERMINKFGANTAISVNFDLDFDFDQETLLPNISITFFAPSLSKNKMHYYFTLNAEYKESISLKEANKLGGSVVDRMYNMINAKKFKEELKYTLNKIKEVEKENPAYQKVWDAMQ